MHSFLLYGHKRIHADWISWFWTQATSLCKLAREAGYVHLIQTNEKRCSHGARGAQDPPSARLSPEQKLRLCGTASRHPANLTHSSTSHFSCCLIKPMMSYTSRLLKRHPRRTAPFWSSLGCHGSISIMSHRNRHTVIYRRGSYAPKKHYTMKFSKAGKNITSYTNYA